MAEHFPHCSAGGRGVRPPTVTAEVVSRRTEDVFLKTPLLSLSQRFFAPEKLNPSCVPGSRAHGRGIGKELDRTKTNGLTSRTPVIGLSPKLRRRYARVLGAVDGLDQSAKVVDSLKKIS
jgi:hypothetical protein